jgi:hypothetical protein
MSCILSKPAVSTFKGRAMRTTTFDLFRELLSMLPHWFKFYLVGILISGSKLQQTSKWSFVPTTTIIVMKKKKKLKHCPENIKKPTN